MHRQLIRWAAVAMLGISSVAQAQVVPAPTPDRPTPDAPATAAPNAITPPNGVARGVIQPNRPVDSKMVTRPPNHGHTMPVITPPGVAR